MESGTYYVLGKSSTNWTMSSAPQKSPVASLSRRQGSVDAVVLGVFQRAAPLTKHTGKPRGRQDALSTLTRSPELSQRAGKD